MHRVSPAVPYPPGRKKAPANSGFTLAELLVGMVLGSVVLGALGGALLVSQMRVTAAVRRDLERKDALNRAVALMRSEISRASRVSIVTSGGSRDTADLCNPTSLRLSAAGVGDVCYKITTSASPLSSGYGATTDRPWSGSCLLMRQGPAYRATDGALNATGIIRQVILDDLGSCSGTPSAFGIDVTSSGATGSISRDVDITIRQSGGVVTNFSARTGANPLFAGNDMTVSVPCSDGVCHWKPSFGSASPVTSNENKNIFYFPNRRDSYQLSNPSNPSNPCTYASCTISSGAQSLQLSNVDVLVFADKEIRP